MLTELRNPLCRPANSSFRFSAFPRPITTWACVQLDGVLKRKIEYPASEASATDLKVYDGISSLLETEHRPLLAAPPTGSKGSSGGGGGGGGPGSRQLFAGGGSAGGGGGGFGGSGGGGFGGNGSGGRRR